MGDLESKKHLTPRLSFSSTWEQVMEHICLQHSQSRNAGSLSTAEPLGFSQVFWERKTESEKNHLTDLSVFCSLVGMNHTRG